VHLDCWQTRHHRPSLDRLPGRCEWCVGTTELSLHSLRDVKRADSEWRGRRGCLRSQPRPAARSLRNHLVCCSCSDSSEIFILSTLKIEGTRGARFLGPISINLRAKRDDANTRVYWSIFSLERTRVTDSVRFKPPTSVAVWEHLDHIQQQLLTLEANQESGGLKQKRMENLSILFG